MGTYAWCETPRTSLRWRESALLVSMMVRAAVRDVIESSPLGIGARRRAHMLVESLSLDPPDSALCLEARRRAESELTRPLLLHSLRSYQFGAALAAIDGIQPDREVLFVAAMFHDFGLARVGGSPLGATCFATEGARYGAAYARERGLDADHERRVYEAISLHLHPLVDVDAHGPEARALADGAALDVIGARRHLIPPSLLARVHEASPRKGFREEILAGMRVSHAPGTRARLLLRLGFADLAAACPLDDLERLTGTTETDGRV